MAHGQQRDLVVEVDEPFDDHLRLTSPSTGDRVRPGAFRIGAGAHRRLALARGTHHGLDDTRQTNGRHCRLKPGGIRGKAERRCEQTQLLARQSPDTFAVHRQARSARGRHHGMTFGFEFEQCRRGDRLDFRHDQMRPLRFDHGPQRYGVQHIDDVAAMRHLHGGRVRIAIHCNHLDAIALQFDGHFLAEFARPQQHHSGAAGRQRRADVERLRAFAHRELLRGAIRRSRPA